MLRPPSAEWPTHGQQLDRYGGFLAVKGGQAGFFHTERINDRWWLVTLDRHGFFGIGVTHPITGMAEDAITFAYDGSQEQWMRDGIRRMRELGFNCVWSGPSSMARIRFGNIDADLSDRVYPEAQILYAVNVPLVKHQVELKPGEKRPDVFSDEYQWYVSDEGAKRVAPNRGNPWILGYYYGYGQFMPEDLWINQTLSHGHPSAGRKRLSDVLEQRYRGDVARLDTVHRTSFASFSDLRKKGALMYPRWISAVKTGRPLPAQAGSREILADAKVLLGEIVKQLHKVAHAEIRKHDSNHMVLGSYIRHTTYTKGIWERIGPYIDALGPQARSKRRKSHQAECRSDWSAGDSKRWRIRERVSTRATGQSGSSRCRAGSRPSPSAIRLTGRTHRSRPGFRWRVLLCSMISPFAKGPTSAAS